MAALTVVLCLLILAGTWGLCRAMSYLILDNGSKVAITVAVLIFAGLLIIVFVKLPIP